MLAYNAGGYSWVESELGPKKVKKVRITSAQLVDVFIDDEDDTDPTPSPDPSPVTDGTS